METINGFYSSPIGVIRIEGNEKGILGLYFTDTAGPEATTSLPDFVTDCRRQLDEYFKGERLEFELQLAPEGTDFQQQVWKELLKIPFGETRSYLDIAKAVGDKNSTRAVGNANGKNPVSIVVPCHRVIGSNGKLTGYASGLWRKQWLLKHEHETRYGKQGVLAF